MIRAITGRPPMAAGIQVTGIDHIYITVSNLRRSEVFYDRVLFALGFRKNTFAINRDCHVHYFNRHFGYVLRRAKRATNHDRYSPGLHHLCFRVESIAGVLAAAAELRVSGVKLTEPRYYPEYAADYFSTFFTDPDSLRLEITNYRLERRECHNRWNEFNHEISQQRRNK
jgi:glyoxylase I family protein